MKIESIRVAHNIDNYADTDNLGVCTDKPQYGDVVCRSGVMYDKILQAEGIASSLQAIIYNDGEKPEYVKLCESRLKRVAAWLDANRAPVHGRGYQYFRPANPEYAKEDFERMEKIIKGDIYFITVTVSAVISVPYSAQHSATDVVSDELHGIESDAGDYIEEVENDLLNQVKEELKNHGFTTEQIEAVEVKRP